MLGRRRIRESRSWPILAAPRRFVLALCAVDLFMLVWVAALVLTQSLSPHELGLLGFLAALALGFEEVVKRGARLQLRLSADLKRDMTSVWAIAAAVVLSHLAAAVLLSALFVYIWFRQRRPAGEELYRQVFNYSNVLISCLVAGDAAHAAQSWLSGAPWALAGTVGVCVAIVVYTTMNRCIVFGALMNMGVRARQMLGSRDENLTEFATLCLGGLVALAALTQPLLALLALAPMVTLQRGAVMRALESAATTDAKTGLLNAVAWEEVASRELQRASREGKELAVLIIDIDHFKLVNDVHGHLAGDQVLKQLARTLSAAVREYDTVARFGGEEFVAVLPSTSPADAFAVAERIRTSLYELRVSAVVEGVDPALDQRIAVSIGLAIAPTDGVELPDLLHMADAALYRAKAEGRNRVVAVGEGPGRTAQVLPFV